ncbi:predicted protein [Bathycoccus prasinos]|uniref:mitogen-activated protein kinase kinase n=1 Tax=Bathycoccus prasinos TaxID=41875 RepID=K8EHV9_9CHLO|nr:predicted protein [Bathycoccus prasinos]CCO17616.1 predicted protein [Bathycoccus prasinos]|eukprot:XP_007511495.1 predicted protein [Bathycoccus prasinos]
MTFHDEAPSSSSSSTSSSSNGEKTTTRRKKEKNNNNNHAARKKPANLSLLSVPKEDDAAKEQQYRWTGSGTFTEGDFSIGKLGVQISTSDLSKLDEETHSQLSLEEGFLGAGGGRGFESRSVSVSVSATQSASQSRTASVVDMVGLTRKMEETAMIRARQRPNATSASTTTTTTTTTNTIKNEFNYDKNNTTNDNNNSKTEDQSFSSSTTDGGRNASRSNTTTISMTTTRDNTNNNSIETDTVGGSSRGGGTDAKNSPLDQSLNTSCSNSSLVNEEGGTPRFGTFLSTLDDLDFTNAKILGSGASGVVQTALHKPTQKMVAVKSFRVNLDDDRRKAMITELRTLHESKCPYVVNCYGAFFADGATIRVVLELMDGGSLDAVCKKNKNLPWKEENIAAVASQASTGLHYLHDVLRVVHRDVKPSNILCCLQTGMVKLSDFGVSGRLGESGAECTSWVGTATYMSPERIRGDGYDYKTDCWSLALTLLEFAFGKFPYAVVASNEKKQQQQQNNEGGLQKQTSGGSYGGFWDIMDLIVHGPSPESELCEETHGKFTETFREFVKKGLQKDAEARYTASEMVEHEFVKARSPETDARAFQAFLKFVFEKN